MRHYSEARWKRKQERQADAPIALSVRYMNYAGEIDACDYIFLKAFKAGYNQHKKEVKSKNKIRKQYEKSNIERQQRK